MVKEFFGQYLIRKGKVTQGDIEEALVLQGILKDSLGAVALANDLISYREVGRILEKMDSSGDGFAECTVNLGILTESQVEKLRSTDSVGRIRIGQLLVATAKLSREELETELAQFGIESRLKTPVNITRSALVEQVAERCGLEKRTVRLALETILDTVSACLEDGAEVKLRGFGTFRTKKFPARKARNPRTGETIYLPARRSACLEFARQLKSMVEQGKKG